MAKFLSAIKILIKKVAYFYFLPVYGSFAKIRSVSAILPEKIINGIVRIYRYHFKYSSGSLKDPEFKQLRDRCVNPSHKEHAPAWHTFDKRYLPLISRTLSYYLDPTKDYKDRDEIRGAVQYLSEEIKSDNFRILRNCESEPELIWKLSLVCRLAVLRTR